MFEMNGQHQEKKPQQQKPKNILLQYSHSNAANFLGLRMVISCLKVSSTYL